MVEEKKPIKPWEEKKFNPNEEKEEKSKKESIPPNIEGTVREEFAKAKARAFGKKPTVSPLEEAALEWRKRKEQVIQEWEGTKEGTGEVVRPWTGGRIVSQEKPIGSFKEKKSSGPPVRPWEGGRLAPDEKTQLREMFATQVAKAKERAPSPVEWEQYSPWKKEEEEKKTPRRLNMATIHALARKIIAQEWRRIRGRPKPDPRAIALEREAVTFQERRLEEKLRKEEEQKKIEEMVKRYQSQLQTLVNSLQAPKILRGIEEKVEEEIKSTPSDLELVRNALEEVGRLESLRRTLEGFEAQLEPWHEMKLRMMQLEETPPIFYTAEINKDFELASYSPRDPRLVEGKEKRIRVQKAMLEDSLKIIRDIKKSVAAGKAEKVEEVAAPEGLEVPSEEEKKLEVEPPGLFKEALSKVGRIVKVNKTEEGWEARVEPWEEMRARVVEKQDKAFIYNVKVNNNLELVSYLPLGYTEI